MASMNLSLFLSLRHTYTVERAGVAAGRRREERDCPGRQLGIRGSGYRAEISRSQNKCRNRPCWHAPAIVYTLRLDFAGFRLLLAGRVEPDGRACEPYYRLLACLQTHTVYTVLRYASLPRGVRGILYGSIRVIRMSLPCV